MEEYDIILVDDEQLTLMLFDMHTANFYTDIKTRRYISPKKALEDVLNDEVSAEIWMIDLMMLEMNGIKLSEQIMKKHPKSRICFYTALTPDVVGVHFPGINPRKIFNKTKYPLEDILKEIVKIIRKKRTQNGDKKIFSQKENQAETLPSQKEPPIDVYSFPAHQ